MKAICGLLSRHHQQSVLSNLLQDMVSALPLACEEGSKWVGVFEGGGLGFYDQHHQEAFARRAPRGTYDCHDLAIVCESEFYNAEDLRKRFSGQVSTEAT